MTITMELERDAGEPPVPGGGYVVRTARSLDEALGALRLVGTQEGASPFQDPMWLTTWFKRVGRHPSVRPLVVSVYDGAGGQLAMVLPLITLSEDGRTIIEFADLGVTDYNAPLLGPAAPRHAAAAKRLWNAVKRALPPADLIKLAKMPARLGARPNPLALLKSCYPSNLRGNILTVASYDDFKRDRGRVHHKEMERSWRVFQRLGGTEFRRVTDVDGALGFLRSIEEQQRQRIKGLGLPYILDLPDIAAFYRGLVADGLSSGFVVITVLLAADEVVAALLGVRQGETFSIVRISNAGQGWKACSPGRLVITRTVEHMLAEGCSSFDFTIGDYEFKRRFSGERLALFELTQARSWRGLPMAGKAAAMGRLRRHPKLMRRLRRFFTRETTGPKLMMASY